MAGTTTDTTPPDASKPDAEVVGTSPQLWKRWGNDVVSHVRHRFSLIDDKAENNVILTRMREASELKGHTLWVLMFAILIASIGLNVNATAVVIGAMLISPLMGPIMGIGLGVSLHEWTVLRRSAYNLLIITGTSLIISVLYFAASPLSEAKSELLSRTTPTLWDVLIATFGGLAGTIATTRREGSNVIPGVAIATALMPPLCTTAYGISQLDWEIAAGAFYLYSINCVFVAIATMIGVRMCHVRRIHDVDHELDKKVRVALVVVGLITALPSAYLAFGLVHEAFFTTAASRYIKSELEGNNTYVSAVRIDAKNHIIDISTIGKRLDDAELTRLREGIRDVTHATDVTVHFHQAAEGAIEQVATPDGKKLEDVLRDTEQRLDVSQQELEQLRRKYQLQQQLGDSAGAMAKELTTLYPTVTRVSLTSGSTHTARGEATPAVHLTLHTKKPGLDTAAVGRIVQWFKGRTGLSNVTVSVHGG